MLLLLLLVGCSTDHKVSRNSDLESSFSSIVKDEKHDEIHIKSLTDFDWDKAYLFTPYFPEESIKEQLGTDFKGVSDISWREDIYLLVFLNEDNIVQYAEIERFGSNFAIGEKEYLTPTDDAISIERDFNNSVMY